jgi:hypothetical protein
MMKRQGGKETKAEGAKERIDEETMMRKDKTNEAAERKEKETKRLGERS